MIKCTYIHYTKGSSRQKHPQNKHNIMQHTCSVQHGKQTEPTLHSLTIHICSHTVGEVGALELKEGGAMSWLRRGGVWDNWGSGAV